jgi:iron complex transport system substrate-binding protein
VPRLPAPPPLWPLLAACALLAACGRAPSPSPTGTATDDLGRPVALPEAPARVLSLAPNLTELLVAPGPETGWWRPRRRTPTPPASTPSPQYSTYPLDVERVVALRPDLLLAHAAINRPDVADRLAELGVPTYFFRFETVGDVPRALRTLGELFGTEGAAEAAAEAFEARLAALAARTDTLRQRPRALLLIGAETLYAFGGASYTQELIRLAGGESLTAQFPGEGVTLSPEYVLEARPEVIVGAWGEDFDPAELLRQHPTWRALPAVRDGRVHGLDPDLLLRPGPRLADGAEALARLLHP